MEGNRDCLFNLVDLFLVERIQLHNFPHPAKILQANLLKLHLLHLRDLSRVQLLLLILPQEVHFLVNHNYQQPLPSSQINQRKQRETRKIRLDNLNLLFLEIQASNLGLITQHLQQIVQTHFQVPKLLVQLNLLFQAIKLVTIKVHHNQMLILLLKIML